MDPDYPIYSYMGVERRCEEQPLTFPPQHQYRQPGLEWRMHPRPIFANPKDVGSGKLKDKVALITGGDSGIGRAVAVAFAKEGADVVILYLHEHEDAAETAECVRALGRRCLPLACDLRDPRVSPEAVARTLDAFDRLDVLVNNAGVLYRQPSILAVSDGQMENTFRTNIFPLFYMTKAALPHLGRGSAIISTASTTAYRGEKSLIDYAATKGAIVSFTRSLAMSLVEHGIRVNAVAPGPTWTPLVAAGYSPERTKIFGTNTPMRRPAQPFEIAPAFVYLASDDSCYVTGQVLHVNGGMYRSS